MFQDRRDIEKSMKKENKLFCICGGELIGLKAPTFSGHTHQCKNEDCERLAAPYGLEDRYK